MYTLYRRFASFNSADGNNNNDENRSQEQQLFQAQVDTKLRFWCEKGQFNKRATRETVRILMAAKPPEVYNSLMTEAKLRILAAERVLASTIPITGLPSLDYEFCFLQIRRVIELITFGGMVREKHRYARFRETEPRKPTFLPPDPTKDWNAKEILSKLVKLSPHMLPIPLGAHAQTEPGVINFDRANVKVTHGRLIEIYEECSRFMHAKNPLVEDFHAQVERQRSKYLQAPAAANKALAFLRQLLWLHAVVQLEWTNQHDATSADNPTSAWIVDFSSAEDTSVQMTLATTQDIDPS